MKREDVVRARIKAKISEAEELRKTVEYFLRAGDYPEMSKRLVWIRSAVAFADGMQAALDVLKPPKKETLRKRRRE